MTTVARRASVTLRLVNPVYRLVCQSAWRWYADDLNGLRAFMNRMGTVSATLSRPARGCSITNGELGGLPTRIFEPRQAQPGRTVLYLHGGGYLMYAASSYTGFLSRLADELDARVAVPAYRLAPEHPFPAAMDDCLHAYATLLESGQDPARLMIAGESAGANAALVTLQRARALGMPMPAAAILLSGGFDFSWASASIVDNARRDVAVGPRGLAFLRRWYRPEVNVRDPRVSPVYGNFDGLPPLLFQTGDTEVLRDDSTRAAAHARDAGVDARLELYRLVPHAWHQLGTWLPETRTALRQIANFATEIHLSRSAS